jgi:putative transposase
MSSTLFCRISVNLIKQEEFLCDACDYAENADLVGAINILERGQHFLACGEEGSGRGRQTTTKPASMKHEPTEVTAHEVSPAWHRRNPGFFRAGRMSSKLE